jgi:hypothetical protein
MGSYGSARCEPCAVIFTTEQPRCGAQSARITVREGNIEQVGDSGQLNERAELDSA